VAPNWFLGGKPYGCACCWQGMLNQGNKRMKMSLMLLSITALIGLTTGCVIHNPDYVITYAPSKPLTNSEPAHMGFQEFKNDGLTNGAGQVAFK